jgi:hypothetical protein
MTRAEAIEAAARVVVDLPRPDAPIDHEDGASIAFFRCCGRAEYRPHADDCPWLRHANALDALEDALTLPE